MRAHMLLQQQPPMSVTTTLPMIGGEYFDSDLQIIGYRLAMFLNSLISSLWLSWIAPNFVFPRLSLAEIYQPVVRLTTKSNTNNSNNSNNSNNQPTPKSDMKSKSEGSSKTTKSNGLEKKKQ